MTFVSHFPCGYTTLHVVTYFKVSRRLEVKSERIWEYVFSEQQNLIFSIATGSIVRLFFVLD